MQNREGSQSVADCEILQWTSLNVGLCGRLFDECYLVLHHATLCGLHFCLAATTRCCWIPHREGTWYQPCGRNWLAYILQVCRHYSVDSIPVLHWWHWLERALRGIGPHGMVAPIRICSIRCICIHLRVEYCDTCLPADLGEVTLTFLWKLTVNMMNGSPFYCKEIHFSAGSMKNYDILFRPSPSKNMDEHGPPSHIPTSWLGRVGQLTWGQVASWKRHWNWLSLMLTCSSWNSSFKILAWICILVLCAFVI